MFKFSDVHNWNGKSDVKQVLVFPSQIAKDKFNCLVEKKGIEKASDIATGAVYKIRISLYASKIWVGSIICGVTDEDLFYKLFIDDAWEDAILFMVKAFRTFINESCKEMVYSVFTDITIKQEHELSNKIELYKNINHHHPKEFINKITKENIKLKGKK